MSTIAKPFTFSPNTTISSSQTNSNFDTLYNDYNGSISAANLATGAVTTAKIADFNVTTAKIADSSVTDVKLVAGMPVQVVSATYNSASTMTTTIPLDDTVPQNTEGTEVMSVSITPKSATNILVVETVLFVATDTADRRIIQALFQDSTAGALAANNMYYTTANSEATIPLRHKMTAGTTSATTFKLRIGPNAAATLTFNGRAGSRLYGDIVKSSIMITEYKV